MSNYVLDSSAVLCFLRNEAGAEQMDSLFADVANEHVIHAVNWVEVRYLEKRGRLPAETSFQAFVERLGIKVSTDLRPELLDEVARLKAEYPPIALGDCFAVALAQTLRSALISTSRTELEKVASAGECEIIFLR